MIVHRCPNCGRSDGLWQALNISGWQALDENGQPERRREADWAYVDALDEGGCGECEWNGPLSAMRVALGIDGEPLPEIHPTQMEIT